jgi:hypothetical protein
VAYNSSAVYVGDWTDITLLNGWTGALQFRASLVTCRLTGGIIPPVVVIGNQLVGLLPAGTRPDRIIRHVVPMGLTTANFTVNPDGTIVYSGVTTGITGQTMNLDGMSWYII